MPDRGFLTENSDSLQVLTGLVSLVVTLLLALLGWWLKRKQVTYRVHLDTPVGINPAEDTSMIDVQLFNKKNVVDKPSFALVRIVNTGNAAIRTEDIEDPLTLEFGGRTVVDAEIVEGDALRKRVERYPQWPEPGGAKLVLPKSPLNRKDRVKLLVLLSGEADPDRPVTCDGFISGGRVIRDTTVGYGPRRRTLWLSGTALVVTTASVALVISGLGPKAASDCAAGDLTVAGSSAFAEVLSDLVDDYNTRCRSDVRIDPAPRASYEGLDWLAEEHDDARQRIATVDGNVLEDKYKALVKRPVGTVTFAVVVNAGIEVTNLTGEEIRDIYNGERLHWDEGGANPIVMVGRNSGSGTRAAFEATFLDGNSEPGVTTDYACQPKPNNDGEYQRCEKGQTADLLAAVAATPGAIGYAELGAANEVIGAKAGLKVVSLNGVAPDDPAGRDRYPFLAGEYFYTRDRPAEGTLAYSFIQYATGERGQRIVTEGGFGN